MWNSATNFRKPQEKTSLLFVRTAHSIVTGMRRGLSYRNTAQTAVAFLMLGLWFAINLVSASPILHHWFHCDSGQLQHHCLVTAMSKDGALPAGPPALYHPPEKSLLAETTGCSFVVSFLSYSEPLTRGPPSNSFLFELS
jgi:hypothetical protein